MATGDRGDRKHALENIPSTLPIPAFQSTFFVIFLNCPLLRQSGLPLTPYRFQVISALAGGLRPDCPRWQTHQSGTMAQPRTVFFTLWQEKSA